MKPSDSAWSLPARHALPRWRSLTWWPGLIAPAAVLLLAGIGALGAVWPAVGYVVRGPGQTWADEAAPYLVAAAVGVCVVRTLVTRNGLNVIVMALATVLLLREIHFEWTHRGVYPMLAGVGLWAVAWRRRLRGPVLGDLRRSCWLAATLSAYLLAFLISRRAFRFVPGEQEVHAFLEEGLETVCHGMLVVASAVGCWRRMPAGERAGPEGKTPPTTPRGRV